MKWQIGSAAVLQAVRDLGEAQRDAVLVLRCESGRGEIELVRGQVFGAQVGRLSGIEAFQLLLMFGTEVVLRVRPNSAPGPRNVHLRMEPLVEVGLQFVEMLDKLSDRLGEPGAHFYCDRNMLAATPVKLPAEVRAFAELVTEPMPLVELIAGSDFRPIDTIKVCYRLCQVGVLVPGRPVVAQPKVDDTAPQPRIEPHAVVPPPLPAAAKVESTKRPRRDASGEVTSRRAKLSHTSRSKKFSKASLEDVPFDAVDEAFFAGASALEEPEVERFVDLENTATRRKLAQRRL